jgi:hypothetical protein
MHEAVAAPLTSWANFYVITGSAAAALTGLMFVVVTLLTSMGRRQTPTSVAAFGTPTVVHFCAALLISAMLTAPWPALWQAALLLGLTGFSGMIYGFIVFRRARIQKTYQPVLEDWLFHIILPFVSYTTIFISALFLTTNPTPALFAVGSATILYLFIGIHNAWDTVTYASITRAQEQLTEVKERVS